MDRRPEDISILIGCEQSGTIRDAFAKRGFDAWSCDIENSWTDGQHIRGDVLKVLSWKRWTLGILHPECKALAVSGNHVYADGKPKHNERLESLRFVKTLWDLGRKNCDFLALENSKGVLTNHIGPPDQIVQPWQFGHDAAKGTCLWLHRLEQLIPTKRAFGRIVPEESPQGVFDFFEGCVGKERFANQTDTGQNKLGETKDRSIKRAKTYDGIAEAMATQWGEQLLTRAKQWK